jgi:glycosyltransferase involved in cell wall biosynthesis
VRILVAHNTYLQAGGEDVVVASEMRLMRDLGWEVECYEVSNERVADLGHLRAGLRTSWSPEAAREVGKRLDAGRYQLLHVHNWFPLLSPSIHWAAARRRIPVVQTLHNYRLTCLAASLTRDGRRCTDCVGKKVPWAGVLHACYRSSRPASLALGSALVLHRALGTWRRKVSVFVALSEYSRRILVHSGLPAERIVVKPNFVDRDRGPGEGSRRFALFAGRLTPGKGVSHLLAAWSGVELPLRIAGDGPSAAGARAASQLSSSVEWLGRLGREELLELMGQAAFVVVPSLNAEGCPLVVLEAFSRGTPVIATRGGALEDVVVDGENGRLVPAGDIAALAAAIGDLISNPEEARRLGRGARRAFEALYSPEINRRMLEAIYRRALAGDGRGGIAAAEES